MTKETIIIILILATLAWSCSVLAEPVGIVEAGYEYNNFQIKFTHTSGITTREQGYGLNMISIKHVWRFK